MRSLRPPFAYRFLFRSEAMSVVEEAAFAGRARSSQSVRRELRASMWVGPFMRMIFQCDEVSNGGCACRYWACR
jgi:hypothetical protein